MLALAHRCANLPLTLRVAAELATAHPAQPLAALVADLTATREPGSSEYRSEGTGNLTAFEMARNVHAHPTLSECLQEAIHGLAGHMINF